MLPPPHVPQRNPNELLCEIENDPLTWFFWSLGTTIAKTMSKLVGLFALGRRD
jgi:hypothetical protein